MTDWNYIKNQFYKKDQPTQKTDYSQYPTGKTGLSPELKEKVKKGAIATSRPMFRALGVAAWPFARTENILAGTSEPLIRTSGERAGDHIRYVISHLYGIEPPQEIKEAVELKYYPQYFKEKGLPALKQSAKNLGLAIKALQFWKKTPEGVSDFTAVMRGWSEGIYGRELKPGTETNISKIGGVGLSYAITPGATGKALRTVGNLAKTTPLYKLIQKFNILD